ncbi:DUF4880 domain-containing protein [Microbacteriaceae bacterium K1510]|nr:DUF4880 domain-containing protein [Microbacteriaceae bacterium K1510]
MSIQAAVGGKTVSKMSPSEQRAPGSEALRAEALTWLRRLNSGEVSADQIKEFEAWRAKSPAHAREFGEAILLWKVSGEAALAARDRKFVRSEDTRRRAGGAGLGRRAFLLGGAAIAASAAGALIVRPPFALWPSYAELAADYRTSTGQQRKVELASRVSVEMNTRTSIDLRTTAAGLPQIELLTGETAISKRDDGAAQVVVRANGGHVKAVNAAFNVRNEGGQVRVACLQGEVQVQCLNRTATLHDGQGVTYDERGLGQIDIVDPDIVTAWQRGLLIFRRAPLSQVVREVNRYRSGRIVLLDAALGRREVIANFRLDRIDDVIDFMAKAMNIQIRPLAGGIVLVG